MPDSLFGSDSEESDQEDSAREVSNDGQISRRDEGGISHAEGVGKSTTSTQASESARGRSIQLIYAFPFCFLTKSQLFATLDPPPIPGLYLFPNAIPASLQHSLCLSLSESVWPSSSNQVMLFDSPSQSSLPPFLSPLLDLLPSILSPLPSDLKETIFSDEQPRQCILNLYHPGQGISPHVDLPTRYEDGIVGVSLFSSTVMEFTSVESRSEHARGEGEGEAGGRESFAMRLKPGSVYVLSGEARYDYKHGIPYREEDVVVDRDGNETRIRRGVRMSITLRRMKPGAEVIGPS
ncbi:uncharacterized protein JCM6883_000452 [Sporobolomyces salmoneus]|uniref:uncharacterized protein n=1 Tax=Sporobolomyces salmoneus TaxID=183962 RepID=UPI00317DD838